MQRDRRIFKNKSNEWPVQKAHAYFIFSGIIPDISLQCNVFFKVKPSTSQVQHIQESLSSCKPVGAFFWLLSHPVLSNWSTKSINSLPSRSLSAITPFFSHSDPHLSCSSHHFSPCLLRLVCWMISCLHPSFVSPSPSALPELPSQNAPLLKSFMI